MKRRQAFTLIELLVVVAIIALLIALLLPQLAKAKDITKKTICLAHLREIGTAFYNYAGNNNGLIPDGGTMEFNWNQTTGVTAGGGSANYLAMWPEELVADGDVLEKLSQRGGPGTYGQYWANGFGIFFCPSSYPSGNPNYTDTQPKPEGAFENTNSGYGMGVYAGSVFYAKDLTTPLLPDMSVDGVAPTIMKTNLWRMDHIVAADGYGGMCTTGNPPTQQNTTPPIDARYGVWRRHLGGANYLMGDAHAEWSVTYNSNDFTKNPLSDPSGTGAPPHCKKDDSIWSHNPVGVRGYYR